MIRFRCPECGEKMEIEDRMAGKRTRCVGCDERIDVPEEDERDRPRRRGGYDDDDGRERGRRRDYDDRAAPRRRRSRDSDDEGLSSGEFAAFAVLFLFIPCINAIVSSILYYAWRAEQPKRANQINMLGFAMFGLHVVIAILIGIIRGSRP